MKRDTMRTPIGACTRVAVLVVSCVAAACGKPTPPTLLTLKKECLAAARKAIESEIKRHENWLKQRTDGSVKDDKAPEIRARLQMLYADRDHYDKITIQDYTLPKRIQVRAKLANKRRVLHLKKQSRSGPWYNVIGSHEPIEVERMYDMTLYLVYPRWYFKMNSHYVYVAAHG